MNWLSLLGLDALAARWRANVIEGAIAVEDRMSLARLEWNDQKQRLQQMLVLTIVVAGLTVVALIMLSLAVLVHFWDTPHRTLVAWLVAGVWTADGGRQMRLAKRLRAGQVFINNYGAAGGVELPFGGVGKSGHGREKGFEALYAFTTLKTVAAHHG